MCCVCFDCYVFHVIMLRPCFESLITLLRPLITLLRACCGLFPPVAFVPVSTLSHIKAGWVTDPITHSLDLATAPSTTYQHGPQRR